MKQNFYVWNWVGGGFNQTYAANKTEALANAKKTWPKGAVDMSTFKRLDAEEERIYWRRFPFLD